MNMCLCMCTAWALWADTIHLSEWTCSWMCFRIIWGIFVICLWWFTAFTRDIGLWESKRSAFPWLFFYPLPRPGSHLLWKRLTGNRRGGSRRKLCRRAAVLIDSVYLWHVRARVECVYMAFCVYVKCGFVIFCTLWTYWPSAQCLHIIILFD